MIIIPRYEKASNSIILFFPEISVNIGKIAYTSPLDGSGEADIDYYYKFTEKVKDVYLSAKTIAWYRRVYNCETENFIVRERLDKNLLKGSWTR